MSKWLKIVPTMTSRKALSTLLLVCHAIIGISGFNMFFNSLKMRSYLWDYMNMSVQGSGAATADAALLALVSIGAVLMVWSVVGSWCIVPERFKRPPCGRCRTCSPIGVAIYSAFLTVVALLTLGVGVTVYRTNLYEGFDQGLNESMAAYGQHNSKSILIDTIQETLYCCGNRGYADWHNLDPPKDIPLSCCKMLQDKCEPQDLEQIYTKGCYNLVLDFISESIVLVASTAICMTILPFGIFLAYNLASNKCTDNCRCRCAGMTYQKTTPTVLSSVYRIGAQGHSIRIMKNRDELIWAMPQIMVGPVSTNTV